MVLDVIPNLKGERIYAKTILEMTCVQAKTTKGESQ